MIAITTTTRGRRVTARGRRWSAATWWHISTASKIGGGNKHDVLLNTIAHIIPTYLLIEIINSSTRISMDRGNKGVVFNLV
jgi:hypothetical protein